MCYRLEVDAFVNQTPLLFLTYIYAVHPYTLFNAQTKLHAFFLFWDSMYEVSESESESSLSFFWANSHLIN